MDAPKALLGAVAGRFLFREGAVTQVSQPARDFVQLEVEGAGLEGARFTPGDKVQVFLRGVGMRTYTPLAWEGRRTSFLGFVHGEGPGSKWLRGLRVGDAVQLFGPRKSIDSSAFSGDLLVVGDETSVALALSLTKARPRTKVVLEAGDVSGLRALLEALAISGDVVARGDHDALFTQLCARLDAGPTPLFTGRAGTIQLMQQRLRAAGRAVGGKSKAYWAEGKRGLD